MARSVLESILADRAVMDEIHSLRRMPPSSAGLDRVGVRAEEVRDAAERLRNRSLALPEGAGLAPPVRDLPQPEAIVLLLGRPPLLVQDGRIAVPELDEWKVRLAPHRSVMERAMPSIGRIELRHHFLFDWVGTGWMITEDVMVTNRHVAEVFVSGHGREVAFRKNPFGETIVARIDFREEHQRAEAAEVEVAEILWVEEADGPDMAFMRLSRGSTALPPPLPLSTHLPPRGQDEGFIATVGYPARDPDRNDPVAMDRIFAEIYDKKRFSPGLVIETGEGDRSFTHDCTTLGGNSGSAVLDIATGHVLGLHFAGLFLRGNAAVASRVVLDRLSQFRSVVPVTRPEPVEPGLTPGTVGDLAARRRPGQSVQERRAEDYADRRGYDPAFITGVPSIEPPRLSAEQQAVAAEVEGGGTELKYTHFSVWMNADRRLAFYTAVNIDGARLVRFPRGEDAWLTDPRIDVGHQVGNHLYRSNRLDRGHLVRRLDPVWGEDEAEARRAMDDTFHYTNAAPQHEELNQVTWLSLEDHLLDNADAQDFRLSVFSGPVFRDDDRRYRGVRLPKEFWKVVVMAREERGGLRPHATAYLLSQADLISDVEFVFGAFKTYQVPVRRIEVLTGLDLNHLRGFDPLDTGTDEMPVRSVPLGSWRDIVINAAGGT